MKQKAKVLVVDDDPTNRIILRAQLEKSGYEVVDAHDGADAVLKFREADPDIVFMDVMMPIMDGYEATKSIREIAGDKYVPIIFLTALTDEEELLKCLDVGGDDFLTKPVSSAILEAELKSIEKTRKLNKKLKIQDEVILRDKQLAEELFSNVIMADNAEMKKLDVIYRPARAFSGDLLLSGRSPSGDLHIMLGDLTGYGLNAAIGALPVSQIFNSMTKKGYSLQSIITEINRKLYEILPTNMFCAAGFISVSSNVSTIKVWNMGLPDIMVFNRNGNRITRKFSSDFLPLGVEREIQKNCPEQFSADKGDTILMMSDGFVGARNQTGRMFGLESLLQVLTDEVADEKIVIERLKESLDSFIGDEVLLDDISFVAIPCTDAIKGTNQTLDARQSACVVPFVKGGKVKWEVNYKFYVEQIKNTNPIPTIVNNIQDMEGIGDKGKLLYTVLSELYVNAVDHGLLKIDSEIKFANDGFENFLRERERRLAELKNGFIELSIISKVNDEGEKCLSIRMEDSGNGFNAAQLNVLLENKSGLSGRGIPLVNQLCKHVHYLEKGNVVEAVFVL